MTFEDVRRIALALPGVTEYLSYGTAAFRAGKLLARQVSDDVVVLRVDFDEREMLMDAEPQTFFLTDHYRQYPALLIRLGDAHPGTVERLLTQAWRRSARKKDLKAFDERT